ncbi:MAG: hypothetical protein HYS13_13585 [Planctomycetia bacterium]|nr:hypothetical protein [Planctomycetia bacterium]
MRCPTICPLKKLPRVLFFLVISLVTLSLVGQYFKYSLGHDTVKGFVPLFYVDYESNVPTWYSSIAILLAAGLLAVVAAARQAQRAPFRHHWTGLCILFLLLSADEVAMVHELPIEWLRITLGATGMWHYTWVIPGMAVVALVGLAYLRFVLALPAATRNLFVLAAAVYVGGAIGVEMLSAYQASRHGQENLTYSLIVTVEEFMEMTGIVVFIKALVDYLACHLGEVRLHFGTAEIAPGPSP